MDIKESYYEKQNENKGKTDKNLPYVSMKNDIELHFSKCGTNQ
jgi:hypothetical protein